MGKKLLLGLLIGSLSLFLLTGCNGEDDDDDDKDEGKSGFRTTWDGVEVNTTEILISVDGGTTPTTYTLSSEGHRYKLLAASAGNVYRTFSVSDVADHACSVEVIDDGTGEYQSGGIAENMSTGYIIETGIQTVGQGNNIALIPESFRDLEANHGMTSYIGYYSGDADDEPREGGYETVGLTSETSTQTFTITLGVGETADQGDYLIFDFYCFSASN